MIKKSITFTDFDGNVKTEEHWFHIPAHKIVLLEYSRKGGLTSIIPDLIKAAEDGDAKELLDIFTEIIRTSYGIRTDDAHFEQPEEEVRKFLASQAWDALWMELATNVNSVTNFLIGIMPEEVREDVRKSVTSLSGASSEDPPWIRENRKPTRAELREMSQAQLQQLYLRDAGAGSQE